VVGDTQRRTSVKDDRGNITEEYLGVRIDSLFAEAEAGERSPP
jgi:hypothetical protein